MLTSSKENITEIRNVVPFEAYSENEIEKEFERTQSQRRNKNAREFRYKV